MIPLIRLSLVGFFTLLTSNFVFAIDPELPSPAESATRKFYQASGAEASRSGDTFSLYSFHSALEAELIESSRATQDSPLFDDDSGQRTYYISQNRSLLMWLLQELVGSNYYRSIYAAKNLSLLDLSQIELESLGVRSEKSETVLREIQFRILKAEFWRRFLGEDRQTAAQADPFVTTRRLSSEEIHLFNKESVIGVELSHILESLELTEITELYTLLVKSSRANETDRFHQNLAHAQRQNTSTTPVYVDFYRRPKDISLNLALYPLFSPKLAIDFSKASQPFLKSEFALATQALDTLVALGRLDKIAFSDFLVRYLKRQPSGSRKMVAAINRLRLHAAEAISALLYANQASTEVLNQLILGNNKYVLSQQPRNHPPAFRHPSKLERALAARIQRHHEATPVMVHFMAAFILNEMSFQFNLPLSPLEQHPASYPDDLKWLNAHVDTIEESTDIGQATRKAIHRIFESSISLVLLENLIPLTEEHAAATTAPLLAPNLIREELPLNYDQVDILSSAPRVLVSEMDSLTNWETESNDPVWRAALMASLTRVKRATEKERPELSAEDRVMLLSLNLGRLASKEIILVTLGKTLMMTPDTPLAVQEINQALNFIELMNLSHPKIEAAFNHWLTSSTTPMDLPHMTGLMERIRFCFHSLETKIGVNTILDLTAIHSETKFKSNVKIKILINATNAQGKRDRLAAALIEYLSDEATPNRFLPEIVTALGNVQLSKPNLDQIKALLDDGGSRATQLHHVIYDNPSNLSTQIHRTMMTFEWVDKVSVDTINLRTNIDKNMFESKKDLTNILRLTSKLDRILDVLFPQAHNSQELGKAWIQSNLRVALVEILKPAMIRVLDGKFPGKLLEADLERWKRFFSLISRLYMVDNELAPKVAIWAVRKNHDILPALHSVTNVILITKQSRRSLIGYAMQTLGHASGLYTTPMVRVLASIETTLHDKNIQLRKIAKTSFGQIIRQFELPVLVLKIAKKKRFIKGLAKSETFMDQEITEFMQLNDCQLNLMLEDKSKANDAQTLKHLDTN